MPALSARWRAIGLRYPIAWGALTIAATLYGVAIGRYQWPPYTQLAAVLHLFAPSTRPSHNGDSLYVSYDRDREALRYAFTDPLITGDKVFGPIRSIQDLENANRAIFMPVEEFFSAYQHLKINSTQQLVLDAGKTHVIEVKYQLLTKPYTAFAFELPAKRVSPNAVLIIPGTGWNESTAIYQGDTSDYHRGVLNGVVGADVFIFIKPNEDILAFHNGTLKIGTQAYVNWHLNRGGSYSASYVTQSLAVVKHLKSRYANVAVVGLSQGGQATLLNALQSEPSSAVVSSGYSTIQTSVELGGVNQVIIPGAARVLDADSLRARLRSLRTRFLFTWGAAEKGSYRIEAEEKLSCIQLQKDNPRVECLIFKGGHAFPASAMRAFLNK